MNSKGKDATKDFEKVAKYEMKMLKEAQHDRFGRVSDGRQVIKWALL